MKKLTRAQLERFLAALGIEYDLRLPVRLADGTRILGRPEEGPLALEGGAVPRKPTELFFPQHDEVFTARPDGSFASPPAPAKPLFVLGLPAADLEALDFVDRFFAAGMRDDLYFRRRDGAVIVGMTGECGRDGEWLPVAGGKCDLELVAEREGYLALSYTAAGHRLAARMGGEEAVVAPERLQREGEPDEVRELLRRASALLLADQVPDEFWAGIADRCIACTGCNLVCPTCTCFGVEDRCWPDRAERSRLWDSCQLDGFMREASGHNPLGTEALRTRRRIQHKLAADVRRWGMRGCVACGRCEAACPAGIGLLSVAREMVERYGR